MQYISMIKCDCDDSTHNSVAAAKSHLTKLQGDYLLRAARGIIGLKYEPTCEFILRNLDLFDNIKRVTEELNTKEIRNEE